MVNNLNGKIFENETEYQNAVIELYKDKLLYNKLSRQAKISAMTHSSRYFASQVLEVYQIAINNYTKLKIPIIDKIKGFLKGGKNE